jgi:hypothetical protein
MDDPGLRLYPPAAAATGPLVPGTILPIAGGVVAHDGNDDLTQIGTAFVLRTTGSVELVDGHATAAGRDGRSGLYLRRMLIHAAQLLNYLMPFAVSIERPEWSLTVNVRDASRAALGNFHPRFQTIFSRRLYGTLNRHLQFRATVNPSDEEMAGTTVRRLDEFLSFAYGYREPRGHGASGALVDE